MLALCNRLIIHHGDGIIIQTVPTRGFDCSLCNAQIYIRDNQIRINFLENAQPCTIFTRPVGIVKRKHPRGQLFDGNIMFRTGIFLRKQPCFFPHDFYRCQTARQGKTVSKLSVRRERIPSLTTSRSTTISMVCFLFLSSVMVSDKSYRLSSIFTRT